MSYKPGAKNLTVQKSAGHKPCANSSVGDSVTGGVRVLYTSAVFMEQIQSPS